MARQLGDGWRVVGGRRMTGGLTSSIHRLAVEHRSGTRRQVVLRRWIGTTYDPGETPADRVHREAAVLSQLAATDVPAPELLGADPTGAQAEVPALLMSRVPGHIHLTPADPHDWLAQMARTLVRIHELDVDAPVHPAWIDDRSLPPPHWTSVPAAWRAAAEIASAPAPAYEPRFTHGDFQHFNLLWQRDILRGVVDWAFAGRSAADGDVAHCRVNLAVLMTAELADEFLRLYEAEAGRRVDPYWDIGVLMRPAVEDWGAFIPTQVAGRAPFDRDGMHRRIDAVLESALRRV